MAMFWYFIFRNGNQFGNSVACQYIVYRPKSNSTQKKINERETYQINVVVLCNFIVLIRERNNVITKALAHSSFSGERCCLLWYYVISCVLWYSGYSDTCLSLWYCYHKSVLWASSLLSFISLYLFNPFKYKKKIETV